LNKVQPKPLEKLEPEPEVEVYHSLTATEMAANKNHLQREPYAIVLPWNIKWQPVPDMPTYPQALIEDARLTHNTKMKLKMIITDPNYFKRIWAQDSRAQYVENYVEQLQVRNKYYEKLQLEHIDLQMDHLAQSRILQHQQILEARALIDKIRLSRRHQR
jgi:hypothetical protein